ncbi:FecR family protein [Flavivirga rizhaonensis]|uniref:FecR family protein n=1 Tax=Flavivirga rizhaonensis TaxID=2559571 RepID=A0A4S1DVB2_9FLAO|nr:FecR family protein [Flavivirga rizhaonensis]TGV01813.1 FecR family protein [Flavivirga rizhaonensis]
MKKLFSKLLTQTITDEELIELQIWLNNPKNQSTLEEFVQDYHDLNLATIKNRVNEAYGKVLIRLEHKERSAKKIFSLWPVYAAAASLVLFISISFLFSTDNNVIHEIEVPTTIADNEILIGTDKAILTLEDGSSIALEKGQSYNSSNVKSNGKTLVYKPENTKKAEITYNYLTIPRGGQYHIKLSDGTEVWLNSESKLKYPVTFVKGETRHVELIYGEAYFEVSPSFNHNGSKFNVLTKLQEVEVLGTEFNIKAYKDEDYIYTTLVEGKVNINRNDKSQMLSPNQQVTLSLKDHNMSVNQVDVYSETSWRKGLFSFKSMPLKDIMVVLSRWYDVDVVFERSDLENIRFNGVLKKNQKLEDILTIIQETKFINAYEITNKTIMIK